MPAAFSSIHWTAIGPAYTSELAANSAKCNYQLKNKTHNTITNTFTYIWRSGTECFPSTQYNFTTGGCANDEQKAPRLNPAVPALRHRLQPTLWATR